MTSKYAQLPADIQDAITTTAGIMLSEFTPETPGTQQEIQQKILFATSGGVSVSCKFSFRDHGADIDNCPKGSMELNDVDTVECMMSGTAATVTGASAAMAIGPADDEPATSGGVETVTPRMNIKLEDYKTMWYVCPYGTQHGFVAIEMNNALSDGGFAWQSTDREKGKGAFSFKGYPSLANPTAVPFKIYIKKTDTAEVQQQELSA